MDVTQMVDRSTSTREWLNTMAREAPLAMIFKGASRDEWESWREAWARKLGELMGTWPEPVPLDSEIVERVTLPDHVREKVVYQTDKHAAIPAYFLIPKSRRDSRPAVLCAHGHEASNVGKEAVAGLDQDPRVKGAIKAHNYDYARQLVRMGYVTIAPDWRAFGERYDRDSSQGRDPCNICQNSMSWLGYSLLSLDVHDAKVAIDYLQSRDEVDPDRIGMVGLSYGGRVTTFTAAVDQRIRVAVVSGALNLFVERIVAQGGCGSQVIPGLLRWGDVPEVLGLIAPRPLLIERGIHDQLLPKWHFDVGYDRVNRVYRACRAEDRLARDEWDGGHAFHGTAALDWFERWL